MTCFALSVPRRACCAHRMHLKMLVYLWNESAQHKLQITTAKQQHAQYEIQNKQTTQQKIEKTTNKADTHERKKKLLNTFTGTTNAQNTLWWTPVIIFIICIFFALRVIWFCCWFLVMQYIFQSDVHTHSGRALKIFANCIIYLIRSVSLFVHSFYR